MKLSSTLNLLLAGTMIFAACHGQQKMVTTPPQATIAFPGAEGFGKFTTGGRGGRVFIVNTLADAGPGSFREAAEAKMPRIIVFAIAGTIHLESRLNISKNATIAGQTAPGDGICLADQPVNLVGDNIIIRYLRFRMGDRFQRGGKIPGNGGDDALGGNRRKHIIIDHCSVSWSTDECFTFYGGDSTTLQWNIISEPLNYSYHFEKGDKDYERHGFGGIWGGSHLSAHHNLFAHCVSRNPRFNGARLGATSDFVDYRNNVIYNWGSNNVYGGEGGIYNVTGNYYKPGPSTAKNVRQRIVNPGRQATPPIGFGKFFVNGNFVEGAADVNSNNRLGIHFDNSAPEAERLAAIVNEPFDAPDMTPHDAKQALADVLAYAGASLPARDTLDQRIIDDVKNGTGRIIDVQGGYPHGTAYENTITAWPALRNADAPADTDKDGIPDEWEKSHKLNETQADSHLYTISAAYTNIEMYINSLKRVK